MSDHLTHQSNTQTQSTVPVQFFETDAGVPTAGTKATPRPPDRPRELPPAGASPSTFQRFEGEAPGAEKQAADHTK
jgi:hypothetical protein